MKEYLINENIVRVIVNDQNILLVDMTEKCYGQSKKITLVNSSCVHLLELLENHSVKESIRILYEEPDNLFSLEELEENVVTTIAQLVGENVLLPNSDNNKIDNLPSSKLDCVPFGKIKGELGKLRRPLIGVVEITSSCNCNCPHCYVKGLDSTKSISTEKIIEIASILQAHGIINVTLTGGEPLSHPDFKQIYLAYKEKGFLIDIFTNALLINEELAELFALYPPRSLDITLYGTSNEEYEAFTGQKKGYDKLVHALDLLKAKGVFFSTKMILNKKNYSHIKDYNVLAKQYGAPFRYNVVIGQGTNTMKDPEDLMLSAEQIVDIEKNDPVKVKSFQAIVHNCNNLPYDCSEEEGWSQYVCGAGIDKVFIGYDGKMSPCMTLRRKGLDLFQYGYDFIWNYWGEQRKVKLSQEFKCMSCEFFPICTPCTEEFEQTNNSKEVPIEGVCELAKKRWKMFINNK